MIEWRKAFLSWFLVLSPLVLQSLARVSAAASALLVPMPFIMIFSIKFLLWRLLFLLKSWLSVVFICGSALNGSVHCVAMFLRKKVAVGLMVREYFWICVLDYSKANSKVRFRDLSGLSPLVKIYWNTELATITRKLLYQKQNRRVRPRPLKDGFRTKQKVGRPSD